MPRQYKRKTNNGQITVDAIQNALRRIQSGESANRVSKETGIPRTTIRRKLSLMQKHNGANLETNYTKSQVFNNIEEKEVAEYFQHCSNMFFGITPRAARELAYQLAVKNKRKYPPSWYVTKLAGKEWLMGFMKRHPELSIRCPEATYIARATSFNRHNVNVFFNLLEERILSLRVEGRQVFNLDETGFTTVQKMPKVMASRGMKQVGQITSRERGELVTVCCIVSATSIAVPPVFIFPRKKFQNHMLTNAPEGSFGFVTDSDWMTSEKFPLVLEHFQKHVKPSKDNPIILILDNHESRLSLNALDYAKANHIHIITLVPHTSNRTQPLDLTVFGPMKTYFNKCATSWMMRNPGKTISIYNIAELVNVAWLKGATPSNIQTGFSSAGIWPFNRNIFPDHYFTPSELTDRPPTPAGYKEIAGPSNPQSATTFDQINQPCTSTQVAISTPSSTSVVENPINFVHGFTHSPADIQPFPKAPPRVSNKRGRKSGQCVVATSSPNIERMRKEAEEKLKRIIEKAKRKEKNICRKRLEFNESSDDDELDISEEMMDDSFDDDILNEEEDSIETQLILGEVKDVNVYDFVLCEFHVKKSAVFYVGLVTKGVDEEGDVEVDFLRKSEKVKGKFIRPLVQEIASISKKSIKAKLTRKMISGTTQRTKDAFFFNEPLDQMNVQ